MSLALLFPYLMLNMFRMLVHPSSEACDLFVELFHGLYFSVRMEVFALAYLFSGECLVVTYAVVLESVFLKISLHSNTTHEMTQQISRKLLRMDVLTSETCSELNKVIKKQVISNRSLFIQLLTH